MAKFTITRLLDTARINKTDTGKQIPEFFDYMAQFVEQTVRNLRSGLTFTDNFAAEARTVTLKHATPQLIVSAKTVVGVLVTRVQSQVYGVSCTSWYYDRNNRLTIQLRFADALGNPPNTTDVLPVDLVLLF
jgi:hypothetical protein